MPETQTPIQPVLIEYRCDEEGCSGTLERDGSGSLVSSPPRYPHECTQCGARQTFERAYPYVTHEPRE